MLTLNPSEFILTVINFFVLLFLLKRFLYVPLVTFMDERNARIEAGLAQERNALAEARERELRVEAQYKDSLVEAKRILEESRAANERHYAQMMEQTQKQSAEAVRAEKAAAAERNAEEEQRLAEKKDVLATLLVQRLLAKADTERVAAEKKESPEYGRMESILRIAELRDPGSGAVLGGQESCGQNVHGPQNQNRRGPAAR